MRSSALVSILAAVILAACGGSGDGQTADTSGGSDAVASDIGGDMGTAEDATPPGDVTPGPDTTTDTGGEDVQAPTVERLDDGAGNIMEVVAEPFALRLYRTEADGSETLLAETMAPVFEAMTVVEPPANSYYDPFIHDDDFFNFWPGDPQWTELAFAGARRTMDGLGLELDLAGEGVTATLSISVAAEGDFQAVLTTEAPETNVVLLRLNLVAPEGENYYGLGEYFDQVAHRGTQRAMQIHIEPNLESGYNEAHVAVPFFVGTKGWGLFVADRFPGAFDMAKADPERIQVTFHHDVQEYHFFAAAHPLDVPGLYTRRTGAPALPPLWSFATLQWRDEIGDNHLNEEGAASRQEIVIRDAETMRALDYPAGAIWIDRPWQSAYMSFELKPGATWYPDPAAMVERLHELGYRLAVWSAPYLTDQVPDAWAEAEANGYFVGKPGGWPEPFDGKLMDLTNPDARDLWQRLGAPLVDLGVEGFKLDYAEDVQAGIRGLTFEFSFFNGEDAKTMHHHYALYYHQTYAEMLPEGGFLLSRAGTWGDQIYTTTIWPGDLDANFAFHNEPSEDPEQTLNWVGGLPAAIAGGVSLSVSGYPWFASDTGGYRNNRPSKELLIRWHQYSALHPIMQMGGGKNHRPWDFTYYADDDVQYDQETLDLCRQYTRLHLQLFPYFYADSVRAHEHGWPVIRPFGMAFPDDGRHPTWTFLAGDSLLVAPVYRAGEVEREVPFPEGRWVDWWTGEAYEGPTTETVAAPLGTLPLFLRVGGIVPMLRPTIDTLAPATEPGVESYANDPGTLWVRILPGGETSFELHDGGRIRVADGREVTVTLTNGGTFSGSFLEVLWSKRGHVAPNEAIAIPTTVTIDGVPLAEAEIDGDPASPGCACWTWSQGRGTVLVDVPAGRHEVVIAP